MRKFIIFSAFLFTTLSVSSNNDLNKIYIAYDDLCPLMCNIDNGKGVVSKIINKVYQTENIEIIWIKLPHRRRLQDIGGTQIIHATFTVKDDAPKLLYPNTPMFEDKQCFYTHTDSNWVYHPGVRNKPIALGVMASSTFPAIDEFITSVKKSNLLSSSSDNFSSIVEMLIRKRTEAIYDISSSIIYSAKKMNKLHLIKEGWCEPKHITGYIAFSPKYPEQAKRWIEIWDRSYPVLLAKGEFDKLFDEFGLVKPYFNILD